jgi:hypothetical protein
LVCDSALQLRQKRHLRYHPPTSLLLSAFQQRRPPQSSPYQFIFTDGVQRINRVLEKGTDNDFDSYRPIARTGSTHHHSTGAGNTQQQNRQGDTQAHQAEHHIRNISRGRSVQTGYSSCRLTTCPRQGSSIGLFLPCPDSVQCSTTSAYPRIRNHITVSTLPLFQSITPATNRTDHIHYIIQVWAARYIMNTHVLGLHRARK